LPQSRLASFIRATSQLRAEVFGPRLFLFRVETSLELELQLLRPYLSSESSSFGCARSLRFFASPQDDNFGGIYLRLTHEGGNTIREVLLM
jgi:hypothetical protein